MNWIKACKDMGDAAVCFQKELCFSKEPQRVEATVTAMGVYNLLVGGKDGRSGADPRLDLLP